MGSKRYLSPREILGDRRRDRHLTAAEILSDELEDDPETPTARPGTSGSGGDRSDRGEVTVKRRETPGTDWQWLDDERVESRSD